MEVRVRRGESWGIRWGGMMIEMLRKDKDR
jgi:hypothetical protein